MLKWVKGLIQWVGGLIGSLMSKSEGRKQGEVLSDLSRELAIHLNYETCPRSHHQGRPEGERSCD